MADIKKELIDMLNDALKLEHKARIQYLAHAELVQGLGAEKLIERLTEIAQDEQKHESQFRKLISDYLYGEPTMEMSETHKASEIKQILEVNRTDEKTAMDFYKKIYEKVLSAKKELPYEFDTLEHDIRHIIIDEQEHVVELSRLLG